MKTPDASALTALRKAEILDPIIAGDSTITGKADNAGKDGKAGGIGFERTQDFRLKAKAGGHPRHLEVASPPPL